MVRNVLDQSQPGHEDLLTGLIRHRWARQILKVLAAHGPLRYSAILRELTLANHDVVHGKSVSAALPYLRETGLITYREVEPRYGVYALTEFGKGLITHLHALEDYLASQRLDCRD